MAEICIIIPALNEEKSISQVLSHLPQGLASETVVVDNNSTDSTLSVASAAGATVLVEKLRGYGAACLKGISYLKTRSPKPDIVIFLDADYSDFPEEALLLIKPILDEGIDFVIGDRVPEKRQKGALKWYQAAGNRIASALIKLFYRYQYSDLGPFRAIKFAKLLELEMKERTFGWTAEMQIKAAKHKLTCREVPVSYRPRIGTSKISGTLGGSLLAGLCILAVILKNLG